jgi:hypothetical protein
MDNARQFPAAQTARDNPHLRFFKHDEPTHSRTGEFTGFHTSTIGGKGCQGKVEKVRGTMPGAPVVRPARVAQSALPVRSAFSDFRPGAISAQPEGHSRSRIA